MAAAERASQQQTSATAAPPVRRDPVRTDAADTAFAPDFGISFADVPVHSDAAPPFRIGDPGDHAERDADRAAELAMRGESVRIAPAPGGEIRLKPNGDSAVRATAAPATVAAVLAGPGRPLDDAVRALFEPRFGASFADVRVHSDALADSAARSIDASAFTFGRHIGFAAGAYAPATRSGQRLLAHELAHTLQGGDAVRRQGIPQVAPVDAPPAAGARPPTAAGPAALTRPAEVALSQRSPGEISAAGPPVVITLSNFAINQAALKARHTEALDALGAIVQAFGRGEGIGLRAAGHADATGEPDVNDPLSARRAAAVAAYLGRASGVRVATEAHGENEPADTNDSVPGRNRNRRVEIRIVPTGGGGSEEDEQERDRDDDRERDRDKKKDDKDDDQRKDDKRRRRDDPESWFCARHPVWCALFGVILGLIILCLLRPARCLPAPRTPPPPKKPPKKRACVRLSSIDLPSGTLRPKPTTPYYLKTPFAMEMDFIEDPARGCICACGEYRQFVRGYFREILPDGSQRTTPHVLAGGRPMSEDLFQEDGGGLRPPYGHRGTAYAQDPDKDADEQEGYNDRFLPDRATGCQYRGADAPGLTVGEGYARGSTVIVHLDFMAMPVDVCGVGMAMPLTAPFFWQVRGQYTRPGGPPPKKVPPPLPKPKGGGSGGGGGPVTPVSPRPYQGNAGTQLPPLRYAGGLSGVGVGPATIRFQFDRNGRTYEAEVAVIVTAADADTITITPANRTLIDIAPPNDPSPAILIVPGRQAVLHRSGL